jgi:hypothetical protein
MADQVQKTPIARTLNQFSERKARGIIALTGRSLPASVTAVVSSGIVTVKFELTDIPYTLPPLTCPLFGPEYVRYPIQAGCKGFVVPADAYLGGVSGLGGGTANLAQRGNLSTLVFFPIGNKGWSATDDPNALVLYGPDGVIIRDLNKTNVLDVSSTEVTLVLKAGSFTVTLPAGLPMIVNGNLQVNGGLGLSGNITAADGVSTYAGNLATTGEVTAKVGVASVALSTHKHAQPDDSHGDVEQPTDSPTGGT